MQSKQTQITKTSSILRQRESGQAAASDAQRLVDFGTLAFVDVAVDGVLVGAVRTVDVTVTEVCLLNAGGVGTTLELGFQITVGIILLGSGIWR